MAQEGAVVLTPGEWAAVRITLLVSLAAVLCTLPAAIGVGWLLARKSFWGKSGLEVLLNLPLVLPPVVTGYLLLVTFGRQGLFVADNAHHVLAMGRDLAAALRPDGTLDQHAWTAARARFRRFVVED